MVAVFALGVPFFAAAASVQGGDKARAASAMSCHDEAGQDDPAGPTGSKAALAHLCCFTVCIPLATPAGSVVSLALPLSEPLIMVLPPRLSPRVIGVDPPPPKA